MGRFSDANIFTSSVLAKKINRQSLQIPPPEFLPVLQKPLPNVFVADEAFPLSENLMRPYPKKSVVGNMKIKFLITDFLEHDKQ